MINKSLLGKRNEIEEGLHVFIADDAAPRFHPWRIFRSVHMKETKEGGGEERVTYNQVLLDLLSQAVSLLLCAPVLI